jgi:hypothetical protein
LLFLWCRELREGPDEPFRDVFFGDHGLQNINDIYGSYLVIHIMPPPPPDFPAVLCKRLKLPAVL